MDIGADSARAFLKGDLAIDARNVRAVVGGAWSQCFTFDSGDDAFVVRFGMHVADYNKDRRAGTFSTSSFPVPRVTHVGEAFDGFYAISTRIGGTPLEACSAQEWTRLIPAVVDLFENIRAIPLADTSGWGSWKAGGNAPHKSWRDVLLAVGDDKPTYRLSGWRAKLATSPIRSRTFESRYESMESILTFDVPRSLVHGDTINRNVHVLGDAVCGVFDWGSSVYGDHLYELAWFEFWQPWHQNLDVPALRRALESRWATTATTPDSIAQRLQACYLYIGLGHLAYHAHTEDWDGFDAVATRMQKLSKLG